MNRLIFEGRFLVNMAATIICQSDQRIMHKRVDWEQMYRVANYHKIANMIYLGILGHGEMVPSKWREHFFERYQQAMSFGESCEEGERELLSLFDMMKIPCVMLESSAVRSYYEIPETAGNNPLKLFLSSECYTLAKGYLVDLGYETKQNYKGYGERMVGVSGFSVDIYHKLPFRTRLFEKNLIGLLEHSYLKVNYAYIRILSLEDRFLLHMAQAVYGYVTDRLLIREMLDLFLYHRKWREQMNQEYINRKLSDLRIDQLSEKLLQLAYLWFGTSEEKVSMQISSNPEVYDVLENRILSRGAIVKETDHQAMLLTKLIERDIEKENRREKWESFRNKYQTYWGAFAKKMRWIFPEFKYMCAIYPILEKAPILLPGCWIRRLLRFGLEAMRWGR